MFGLQNIADGDFDVQTQTVACNVIQLLAKKVFN